MRAFAPFSALFALAWSGFILGIVLLAGGCGGEPVAVQRGAALQPPIACCTPQPLPESSWCSSSTVPGVDGWVICSASPFYPGSPRCALLVRGNTPDLYGYGWSVNGWNPSLLRGNASVQLQWHGAVDGGWWPNPPAPLEHTFTAADRITDVWSW